jgi:outer membrane protein assembly factor BamA
VASADFGSPGPIIDFQPPMTHTLVKSNIRRKGTFEKMFLEGRPPVALGVTSGGDLFGGTQVTFSDVLGDKQFNMFAASVQQYRTLSFSYVNLSRRVQYALQGFSQTQFYYGYNPGVFFGYDYAWIDRDQAIATQTARGATAFAIYPFNRYARVELTGGVMQFSQSFNEPDLQDLANEYQEQQYGRVLFSSGTFMPLGVAYVQETTVFREYGPLAGNTVRIGYEYAPEIGDTFLSRQTVDLDARYYMRLATNGVLAFRARGFTSWGEWPGYLYFGGNSEMRGYEYLEFIGHKGFFANAELRFPLIEAALTPIGVIGGLRGIAFFNIGASGYVDVPMKVWTSSAVPYQPLLGFTADPATLTYKPVFGPTQFIDGFKLVDGRASYGVGLETFALGFPIHFDWSWRTLFNREWEDAVFAYQGGSTWFRKPRFAMWIGYDF